jgi:hypothetical protein
MLFGEETITRIQELSCFSLCGLIGNVIIRRSSSLMTASAIIMKALGKS